MDSDPPKARGKRGGKQAKKQALLQDRFLAGEFVPKRFWNPPSGVAPDPKAPSGLGPGPKAPVPKAPPPKAIASSGSGAPLTPPKSAPEHKASSGLVPGPKALPPKAIASSGSGAPLTPAKLGPPLRRPQVAEGLEPPAVKLRPNPGLGHSLAPSVNPPSAFVRVSLDFHNVLDCEAPGHRTFEGIRTTCADSIEDFLRVSRSHRVGICSYIGWRGKDSRSKRDALRRAVVSLNQRLSLRGIPENQLLCLCITDQTDKPEINRGTCSIHLDDKWSVIQAVQARGVEGVSYTRSGEIQSVGAFFDLVRRRCTPRAYSDDWWEIPQ